MSPMASRGLFVLALAALPVTGGGCAEPAFSAHLRDNSIEDIKRALAASKNVAAGPRSGRPTAYLLTGEKGDRPHCAIGIAGTCGPSGGIKEGPLLDNPCAIK